MFGTTLRKSKPMLLAGFLAGSVVLFTALGQAAQGEEKPAGTVASAASPAPAPVPASVPLASIPAIARSDRQTMMYRRIWGVDNIKVREASSGLMLVFSYRIVDANKAKVLNDKKNTPYLIDATTGVKMEVPTMEKVGQLRQTATPQNGREYWMVFTNKGVRPGSRVNVVIGQFRIDRLVVEGISRPS